MDSLSSNIEDLHQYNVGRHSDDPLLKGGSRGFFGLLSCPGGCSAPPLRFFAHTSEREKDNSTKFGDSS